MPTGLYWLIEEVKGIYKARIWASLAEPELAPLFITSFPFFREVLVELLCKIVCSPLLNFKNWAKNFLKPLKAVYSIKSAHQHYRQQKSKLLSEMPCSQAKFAWTSRARSCITFKVRSTECLLQLKDTSQTFQYPLRLQKI